MKIAVLVARLLLGGVFLFFGLNFLFDFVKPPEHSPEAQAFLGALVDSGYLMPLLKYTEIACGAALVAGVLVPLALTVLAPILVNIALFHFVLEPGGAPIAIALLVLEGFLAFAYRKHFGGVLNPFAQPALSKRVQA